MNIFFHGGRSCIRRQITKFGTFGRFTHGTDLTGLYPGTDISIYPQPNEILPDLMSGFEDTQMSTKRRLMKILKTRGTRSWAQQLLISDPASSDSTKHLYLPHVGKFSSPLESRSMMLRKTGSSLWC
jgi:hypothetical protein